MKKVSNMASMFFAVFLSLFAVPSMAAIPAIVGTTLTAIETDAIALSTIVIPFVISILGLFIIIKLIKKFGNKLG